MIEPFTFPVRTNAASSRRPTLASGYFGMLTLPAKKRRAIEMTHERFQALMTNPGRFAFEFNWPIAA
jgi:hypothetical protein